MPFKIKDNAKNRKNVTTSHSRFEESKVMKPLSKSRPKQGIFEYY